MKKGKLGLLLILTSMVLLLSGCFEFVEIDQPEVIKAGEKVNVKLSVLLKPDHTDPKYGIIGMLIPTDWTVDSVKYAPGDIGDIGPMNCSILSSGVADADTAGIDYWVDSLETRYPSEANTHWVVYQGNGTDSSALDTAYVDVSLYFTSSATTGDFDLRYFITEASEDFSDPTYYEASSVTPISVTDFTSISDIQDTTGTGSGDSKLKGQTVTFTGIISGESWAFGGDTYFVQDGTGPWSGIYVYDSGRENAYGDSVIITGEVAEYYDKTQIKNVTNYVKISEGHKVEATTVTSGEIGTGGSNAEAYEGVLVKVENVEITNGDLGYGEWSVSDGSGDVNIDDEADYYFWPSEYDSCLSVTGILDYSYGDTKILPRLAYDIVEGNKTGETKIYTRIQRTQQVRYSDLIKAENGTSDDVSYMSAATGDTTFYNVKGVVTMPTGLSYAGSGIKFLFQDLHGGPWSSIMSYNSDSTAYPVLYEGDIIEMTGYIDEYITTQSYMTEFFLTGAINILSYGNDTPEPDLVTTGDLRLPKTAEQYGTNIVKIKDAVVTNVDPSFEIMGIDDGSGEVLVDDDSYNLDGYITPPMLTPVDSITGWVYHHYGSYADSTTYKLCPLYMSDIVLGEGPPTLLYPSCTPNLPTSSETAEVSITISTQRTITDAKVSYRVNQGSYSDIALTEGADNVWSATIPAQSNSDFVDYFFSATDDSGDVTLNPEDTSLSNHNYIVLDGDPTIHDIQYTPWKSGGSPLVGVDVHLNAIVTTNSNPFVAEFDDTYGVLGVQSGNGLWNGILLVGSITEEYVEGETVEIWGTVTETFEDDYWQWSANTYIDIDSLKSTGTGTAVKTDVTVAELADNPEAYEGVLVNIAEQVTIASINQYDMTITDGTNNYLIDDDAVPDSIFQITNGSHATIGVNDTLYAGDLITGLSGISLFSYGTHKIEIRKISDFEEFNSVDEHKTVVPENYSLLQNYPNPFNPSTNIAFDLPNLSDVTIVIYNIRGQLVKVLTKDQFNAGHHIVRWNGINRYGQRISTGVYIYRIMANDFVDVKKMVYLK